MAKLNIDFAVRRQGPAPLLALPLAVLALALLYGLYRFTVLTQASIQTRHQLQTLSDQSALAQARLAPVPMVAVSPDRARALSEAVSVLNVAWPQLLSALERSKPARADLLRLEPRLKDKALVITVQAPDVDTVIGFMDELARTAPFHRVTPVSQEVVNDEGRPALQSTFQAYWKDAP